MSHNTKIPFKGEADEAPNTVPGDVIVVLQQKEHEVFKRDGPNLFMKKKLTLQEALCGFKFTVVHLDNRHLIVKSEDSTIITPGAYKAIKDEGMPSVKNPYVRGNLYIEFEIEFPKPEQLTKEIKQSLSKLLPLPLPEQLPAPNTDQPMETEHKEAEEVTLTDVDITQEKKKFEEQHKEAYEEDEDKGGRGQGQPCRAQ